MLAVFRFVFCFFLKKEPEPSSVALSTLLQQHEQPACSFPVVSPDLPQLNWKYCEIISDLPGIHKKRVLTPYNLSSFSLGETEKPEQEWNLGAAFSYTNNQSKALSRIKALRKHWFNLNSCRLSGVSRIQLSGKPASLFSTWILWLF